LRLKVSRGATASEAALCQGFAAIEADAAGRIHAAQSARLPQHGAVEGIDRGAPARPRAWQLLRQSLARLAG
jgi:hypothetical protein